MITTISDPDDPRIEGYHAVRERDLVGRHGRFIAEGEVVLSVLLQSDYEVESFLLSEKQIALAQHIRATKHNKTPIYIAAQSVMDRIVGFHIHRGILAIGKRPSTKSIDELLTGLPNNAVVLGLLGLCNHDNIGGIFRNAAAFGVDAIVMDEACCDPLYRKALRVSVGGVLKVPFSVVTNADDLASALKRHNFRMLALSPSGKTELETLTTEGRTALFLGSEGPGLPETFMANVETVSIKMQNAFDSLNVATTSGIALYQITKSLPSV
ncbi:RNA methyltransferase [Microvirga sp. W0021]|uniref:RNA methyltransferase n=1 Tax=Hohaiivirga grylli TaxID=3133970 RepID=A0ABV0BNY6_9HYPH